MSAIYVPLDIETTGLDEDNDKILEIAWQVLDEDLNSISPLRSFIVEHGDRWGDVFSLIKSNDVVLEMHRKSGLAVRLLNDTAVRMQDIRKELRSDVNKAGWDASPGSVPTVHLMGANISFDREFMKRDLSLCELFTPGDELFSHRLYDVRGIKMAYETAGLTPPETNNPNPHRAASDVQETIDFARAIRAQLMTMKETVR